MPATHRSAVLYACDANYHTMTLYSLASVARLHRAPLDFRMVQIDYQRGIPKSFHEFVESLGHRVLATSLKSTYVASESRVGSSWAHITDAMFHKSTAIQAVAPDYDYILYLDSDVLAFSDLRLQTLVGFHELFAACLDLPVASGFEHPEVFANCEQKGTPLDFFNSGVILVNVSKWLAARGQERFVEALKQHSNRCPYFGECLANDQCAFNMVAAGDFLRLPLTLNVQQAALHTGAWKDAVVRHYNGKNKFLNWRPWTCDQRQHVLVQAIGRETGLPGPYGFYDFGFSYWLNGLRRRKTRAEVERAIKRLSHRISSPAAELSRSFVG